MHKAVVTTFAEGQSDYDIIWENPCFRGRILPRDAAPNFVTLADNEVPFYTADQELIVLRFPEGHPLPAEDTLLTASARRDNETFEVLRYRVLTPRRPQ